MQTETTSPGGLTTTVEGDNGDRRDLDIDASTSCDPGLVAVPAIGLEDVPLTFPQRVRFSSLRPLLRATERLHDDR
jgi:hypothetical protein